MKGFCFVAGLMVAVFSLAFIDLFSERFDRDWCKTTDTGKFVEYDEQRTERVGRITNYKTVHVVKREQLVICKKVVWVQP